MPDGHVITDVPEDVTDDEVVAKYRGKRLLEDEIPKAFEDTRPEPPAATQPPEESFGQDYARVITRTGASMANLPLELIKLGREAAGMETAALEASQRRMTRAVAEDVSQGVSKIPVEQIITAEDKVKTPETVGGLVFSAAPYLVGGAASMSTKLVKALPRLVQGVASGVAVDQILYDGEDNLANVLDDAGLVQAEGMAKDLVDFFAVKEDDDTLERRAKLIAEGVVLGGAFEVILGGSAAALKAAKAKFGKGLNALNAEEKSELVVDYLKEARETVQYRAVPEPVEFNETAEGVAQIAQQNSSGVKRFMQQVFSSRGYFTPKAYNAFNDAQYAQRQVVAQAENISNRLQQTIRSVGDEVDSSELVERINKALVGEELEVPLPANIAKEVEQARELIDEMSGRIINSSIPNDEFKEVISENAGSYLRRSYRLFEDTGYKPSANIRSNAQDYIANVILSKKKDISIEQAFEQADGVVKSILRETSDEGAVFEYFQGLRRVNTEILQGRKDIPEPIRALMGEITEPAENIVLTISKMARLVETNKFFESVDKLGAENYIFDGPLSRDGVEYTAKITGTNSVLDGKYTTAEMLTALKEKESMLLDGAGGAVGDLYRNFLTLKGGAQLVKTVYSHVTHLRNILGGAQFGMANGTNPFGREGVRTLSVLKNRISQGGDEALDEMYQKYLRLGIINTNVRVNEFRALLDTGFETKADTFGRKLSEKLQGYGLSAEAQKLPEEIYMAVDDFYKVTNFEYELDVLKQAFPDESVEVLEARAADIVQNTFPNYDRVPKGIKALRYLPVGNFVSFPTEIWRTSANILKQASAEINSGSEVLKARGIRRMAGYGATLVGWGAIAEGSAQLAGLVPEEAEAAQYLSETPWSRSPRNFVRIDGKLYANDTQFINSYSAISAPFVNAYKAIEDGTLRDERLDRVLGEAILEGSSALLAPYIEESIFTEALDDVRAAMMSESGRTPEGKQLFAPGMPFTEKAVNGFAHIAQAFEPGTIKSLRDLAGAALEVPNKNTGQPKDLRAELFTNLTGVRFTELNPADALMYGLKDYNYKVQNVVRPQAKYGMAASKVEARYEQRQRKLYEYQQDLYTKYIAAERLLGREEAIKVLIENGMSKEQVGFLVSNTFRPERPSMNLMIDMFEKLPAEEQVRNRDAITSMFNRYSEFYRTPLIRPVEEPKVDRQRRAKGGEVFVPQAPSEPDERIDKMTGLPYNIQAGGAFIDEEDPEKRMGFVQGGIAQMLGIDPQDLEWAKSLGKKFGEAEELDGRGDAARHLALGWLAKKSNYPSLTKFAINAREALDLDFKGGPMDVENNKRGFSLPAQTREEAERQIMEAIDTKAARFYTPSESRQMRGYAEGGKVEDEEDGFFDRLSEAFVKKVFGDGSVREEFMQKETADFQMTPAGPIAKAPEINGPLIEYGAEKLEEFKAKRQATEELFQQGEITDVERGVRQAAADVSLVTAPIADLVSATTEYIPYFDEAAKALSETDAVQSLAKLAADNPRATDNVVAIAEILGVIPAAKIFERGINRTASAVNTNIKGYYGPGVTTGTKVALAGKEFTTRVPSSIAEAFGPNYNAVRRETGLSPAKIETAIRALDKGDSKSAGNAMAETSTGRYIGLQSGEKTGIIHERNAITLANEYGYDESFNPTSFKKNVFASIKEGGNLSKGIPIKVQEDVIDHMFNAWNIKKPEETFFIYKRPDGPQKLGDEVFSQGFDDGATSLKKIVGKEKKHTTDDPKGRYKKGDIYEKSGKNKILEFFNNKRAAEGKRPVTSLRSMPPETFKDYLKENNIDFKEGPDGFIYINDSYVSHAKEIGGVNVYSAIDTNTGDVFAMVSDKHDIFRDIDPIRGRSLMTVQPMIGMNFKTGKSLGYKERDYIAEAKEAKKLFSTYAALAAKRGGSEATRELDNYFKGKISELNRIIAGGITPDSDAINQPIATTLKVLQYINDNPEITAKDIQDVVRRTGTVGAAAPLLTETED